MFNPSSNQCVSTCPDGFYADLANRTCQPCSSECLSCQSNSKFCTSCKSVTNVVLKNNRCQILNTCDSGSYYDAEKKHCHFCDITCKECHSSEQTGCTECFETRPWLLNGKCVARCPIGYWKMDKECLKCGLGCSACEEVGNKCTSCLPGFVLNSSDQCELFKAEGTLFLIWSLI